MKKLIPVLSLLWVMSLMLSCDDDNSLPSVDTTSVTLNFLATYNGQPLLFNQDAFATDYQHQGKDVFFQRFSFFLSNISFLETENEDEVELSEIEFLDFTNNGTVADATSPQRLIFNSVPVGSYKGIKMSLGVPADLNRDDPEDYGGDHPLNNAGHYWADWISYIFLKVNGIYDKGNDGINVGEDTGFAFHTGADETFRNANPILTSFDLVEGTPAEFTIEVDMKKIMGDIDFGDNSTLTTHDISNLTLANIVMDNFQNALTLKN